MLALVLALLASSVLPTTAASPSDFSSASDSIEVAYVAVNHAQQSGGNVTALVSRLNAALELYMRAESENSTDPTKARSDLQNATQIAQQVGTDAPAVAQAGQAARQAQEYLSVGGAAAIIAIAALIYLYGDRLYRALWLRLYGNHTVRGVG
jgi:hypothetical protein